MLINRAQTCESAVGLATPKTGSEDYREFLKRKVELAKSSGLERRQRLPVTFMLLQPPSWSPEVWTDITRMRTLNGAQSAKGKVMHLCPLQFDICERVINQFSMAGETVLDPFGGLMTVPMTAVKMGRRGIGIELSNAYFVDGCYYVEAAAQNVKTPGLFDLEKPQS